MKTNALILFAMALSLIACGQKTKTNWLMSPPVKYERVGENTKAIENPKTPKIEILFVIDNSKSMDKHIQNLSNNIDQFVSALSTNLPFPFHVGVTTVYDSRGKLSASQIESGELVQVKSAKGELIPDKYFISSEDEEAQALLRQTLKVGTLALEEGGPEVEELFTPVASLYGFGPFKQSQNLQRRQAGFFMGADAHKVIFFISDAADNSTMTETELFQGLIDRTGGEAEKILAFAALIKTPTKACAADPGMKNQKLPNFLEITSSNLSRNNILDLCSNNFGRRLAQVGSDIRKETLTRMIRLQHQPDFTVDPNSHKYAEGEGIWVTYGSDPDTLKRQRLHMEIDSKLVGYIYNPQLNGIFINPEFEFDIQPNAYLRIEYIPILASSVNQGRVKPWLKPAE